MLGKVNFNSTTIIPVVELITEYPHYIVELTKWGLVEVELTYVVDLIDCKCAHLILTIFSLKMTVINLDPEAEPPPKKLKTKDDKSPAWQYFEKRKSGSDEKRAYCSFPLCTTRYKACNSATSNWTASELFKSTFICRRT